MVGSEYTLVPILNISKDYIFNRNLLSHNFFLIKSKRLATLSLLINSITLVWIK